MYCRMEAPVPAAPAAPAAPGFEFSWDTFFTIVLLLSVCFCFGWWVSFIMGATQTNPNKCTPDGQPSTGVYGSDCCSTNGIDGNGDCQPSGPMGVPPYGIQNSSTPQEYQFNAVPAPTPAAIPTPPVPHVSSSQGPPIGYPPSIWNDNSN